ncbi:MAG: hypothetical protein L6R45_23650 [Anaerolineae bacterium]|nr:hypothetical protein [Anaerolineae bacterium]
MKWFQTLLQKLRGIFATEKKPSVPGVGSSVEQQRPDTSKLAVRTDSYKFEDLDQLVKPLLQKMAEDRWGSGFSYDSDKHKRFKWQIWKSNIDKQTSEYWMVEFIPELGQFEIHANEKSFKTRVSMDDLRTELTKAVEAGPKTRSIAQSIHKDIFWDDIR